MARLAGTERMQGVRKKKEREREGSRALQTSPSATTTVYNDNTVPWSAKDLVPEWPLDLIDFHYFSPALPIAKKQLKPAA